jgi:threonine dehydrogenase-like Zn-dependent dehydrogenase
VGRPGLLDACIAAVRARARVVMAGTCVEPDPFWPIAALLKETTIRFAAYYSPAEFRTVIGAFAAGTIDPGPLVGRRLPLAALDDAFAALAASSTNGKILVEPG